MKPGDFLGKPLTQLDQAHDHEMLQVRQSQTL